MSKISLERTGTFLRILFEILSQHPDGLQAGDAIRAVGSRVNLSEYEAGTYASGGLRFEKILRWATVDCVKAGWLVKQDGRWYVTQEGLAATTKYRDPAELYRKATQLYNAWRSAQASGSVEEPDDAAVGGDVPNEQGAAITLEMAKDQAKEQIAAFVRQIDPYELQDLVGDLLTAMGYSVVWKSPPGKDDGIDLLAYPDPLGTKPPRVKVQVKRYKQGNTATKDDVSAFMGNLGSEEVGLFVCTGGYTKDAAAKARTDKQHRVSLIDLDQLVKLWVRHYQQLTNEARRRLPLEPVYFLAPS